MPADEKATDTCRVKTFLRPDFYEYATLFSPHELTRRAAHLDFAEATLLIPYNIALYGRLFGPADYAGYLNAPEEMRRALLEKVLVRVGISARAAGALVADRAEFVNGDDRAHAYLNQTVTVSEDTKLSMPALVGYLLDATEGWSRATEVVEIGIGTGFHAIRMARLHPGMRITGFETNARVHDLFDAHIRRAALRERIRLLPQSGLDEALRRASHVYVTAAVSQEQLRDLLRRAGGNTTWLLPRALDRDEFDAEPPHSWLTTAYGDYESYRASPAWNAYCVVEELVVEADGTPRSRSRLYDVEFVKLG